MKHYTIILILFYLFFALPGFAQTGFYVKSLEDKNIMALIPPSTTLYEEAGFDIYINREQLGDLQIVSVLWTPFICTGFDVDFFVFKARNENFQCLYYERSQGTSIGDAPSYQYQLEHQKLKIHTVFSQGTTYKELDLALLPDSAGIHIIDVQPRRWAVVLSADKTEESAQFEMKKAQNMPLQKTIWMLNNDEYYRTFIEFETKEEAQAALTGIKTYFKTAYLADLYDFCEYLPAETFYSDDVLINCY